MRVAQEARLCLRGARASRGGRRACAPPRRRRPPQQWWTAEATARRPSRGGRLARCSAHRCAQGAGFPSPLCPVQLLIAERVDVGLADDERAVALARGAVPGRLRASGCEPRVATVFDLESRDRAGFVAVHEDRVAAPIHPPRPREARNSTEVAVAQAAARAAGRRTTQQRAAHCRRLPHRAPIRGGGLRGDQTGVGRRSRRPAPPPQLLVDQSEGCPALLRRWTKSMIVP